MIKFEDNVLDYLNIPSVPKKEWDGKSPFTKGVAVVKLAFGEEAYAVCAYRPEQGDKEPNVIKVFGYDPFYSILKIYVVPAYMANEDEVQNMDLDDKSKERAASVIREAKEIENGDAEDDAEKELDSLPEWIFPHIKTKEEAEAFVREYKRSNGIKGQAPKNKETLRSYLYVIYKNKKTKR